MALSISRPDPTSPASVAEASFSTARRGFDQAEVRDLLRAVAAELGRLQERERFLERELRTAQSTPTPASAELDEDTVTRLLGEETLRVLQTARESASQIRIKAEEGAARLLRDATEEANRIRSEAEIEAARRRSDAAADAEAEVSLAKQQGREMVNEARAYRERVLSELARRREVARQQIEQLIHGRDRLLQVFERARLVAVDVVSELTPLGEPDEYVDLSPTTGPVPMMVPATPRPGADATVEEPADDSTVDEEPVDEKLVVDATTDSADDEATGATVEEPTEAVEPESVTDEAVEPESVEAEPVAEEHVAEDTVTEEPVADEGAGDDNVVALFPSAERERPDVDQLFARLRGSTPADDATAGEEAAGEATAGEAAAGDTADVEAEQPTDTEPVAAAATEEAPSGDEVGGESVFARRDADLVPLIVTAARKLKRVLADEQNEVLDTLRRTEPVRELSALLPAAAEHAGRYAAAIADELVEAAAAGAAQVTDTDVRRQLAGPATLEGVRGSLRTELVAPLRDRLERAVADGAGDNDDITRRVRSVYREWKTQRIDDQLDDLFRLAHGTGILAAVTPGTPMCWRVDPDGPACPDAEDNALAGAVAAGQPYPTGHVVAPAHAGCRCVLSPADR